MAVAAQLLLEGTAASSGPWITTPWIAGAVRVRDKWIYANLLQGNAVLSAANPIFTTGSVAGAVVSATNGGYKTLAGECGTPLQIESLSRNTDRFRNYGQSWD